MNEDLVTISRLALAGNEADIRLFLAKYIRRMKKYDPETTAEIEKLLKLEPTKRSHALRKNTPDYFPESKETIDSNEVYKFLKVWDSNEPIEELLLSENLKNSLVSVVQERLPNNLESLRKHDLKPISSIIFQGPPGVGKSLSAKWLAKELNLPLYILDLTSVMSSYMGKTGNNLRLVLDYAKSQECVLFLDEIDAIAKKRADNSDVGELKRLVTVLLQEIEDWPENSLLIAATNHQELLDPAIWRRFDLDLLFDLPTEDQLENSLEKLFLDDYKFFKAWSDLLKVKFKGLSFSLVKREVMRLRKIKLMNSLEDSEVLITQYLTPDLKDMSKNQQIDFAVNLVVNHGMSQLKASKLANISRDTLRKKLIKN